jgi:lipopolysaccharide transport system ATP-binding protein
MVAKGLDMNSPIVRIDDVHLVYPVYSVNAMSLRHTVLNLAVGGRLMKGRNDVVHVNALDGVSFSLNDGDRLGVVGHNGSGKTTLLKVLAGVYEPDRGRVDIRGEVASMLDIGLGVDWEATGVENIRIMSRLRGLRSAEIERRMVDIIDFSELGAYADLPMKTYSAGMSARLVFTVATSFKSDVLILDEWLGAGDANFINRVSSRMSELVENSRTIVLATHNFGLMESICNKVLHLDKGRVKFFGSLNEYKESIV